MGLFGFGKKSISHKEIGNVVFSHFQKLGSPGDIGKGTHFEKYIQMLKELDEWADMSDFGNLKRAAITARIEDILKTTYKNTGVDYHVDKYIIMSKTIIMKM